MTIMNLYHLSRENLDGETLYPRIPSCADGVEEDNKIPRVCFAKTISGACRALMTYFPEYTNYYVHVPDCNIPDENIIECTEDMVYDSVLTGECWVTTPVKLKCIAKINIGYKQWDERQSTFILKNGMHLYKIPVHFKYIEKYNNEIMEHSTNSIKETIETYYDNQMLEHYGITIFNVNENIGEDISKYKQGVINAIKKLKSQIGDKAGYIISDVIKNAKKQSTKTLFAVLTMLCVFSGSANAHISQQSADEFIKDLNTMYSKSESVGFSTQKDQKSAHYMDMMQTQDGEFFSGYGECMESGNFAMEKARKNARLAAIKRFKETIGNENINDYEIVHVYYCDHSDKSLSDGGQKCVAMVSFRKKSQIADNQNSNTALPTQENMENMSESEIQDMFNQNTKYCIGYSESDNQDDAIKKAINTAYHNYSKKTGNVFNGDKSKCKCIPGKIQKKINGNQTVYCCTYIIKV